MPPTIDEAAYRKLTSRPIVKHADIVPQETAAEAVEVVTLALDKYIATKNYEAAAKSIKDSMDRKFGNMWHCAIGEGFGFDVTYQQRNMIYVYYGNLGILLFKC
mmetsp:Transcript_18587/g.33647  ORF Transcript_18587/g.33647 Transcript_18587/m.33647 type:complete len:104 (+) Transcript_18587:76-387(+)|eukprot:CAMPEP_0205909912 /NCGR_PEP_ID=MMETSP1325-20131115/4155_1 /ASSEMBLY_ACC=CAM_ASM_000708 /TAXON_ID=236786 /ORGANISM="Florenciella sp., Strain RCC1007" /LENGTH=103 /DNA_ID=CAMNT_0053276239 /DNA_START=72 /DNA_END=383 /DNA_ORIENTATION=+